ncbi:putative alpha/Beta hydrolase [Plasmopara halstedii]
MHVTQSQDVFESGASKVKRNITTMESSDTKMRPVYIPQLIIVLVHGNNGSAADFDAVESALVTKFGEGKILIIKSKANELNTSVGVEAGGTRLAKEVIETVLGHELCPDVESYKMSIVGHSLGGLYARYALVQIMDALRFLHVEYVDFVTICTPHLGSRRAKGPSTVKNILRLGVHKMLASSLYGQTGMDLLLDVQEQVKEKEIDAAAVGLPRSVLELMSDPNSEYLHSLKRFRHGTLIAMTDGDVVVPYPSAAMRSYNPYISSFLTEHFTEWRWHIHHFGFTAGNGSDHAINAEFIERLNSKIDTSIVINEHELGLDARCAPRISSIGRFDCDNKQEVEFPHEMLCHLQQVLPWRRIDVTVEPCGVKGKLRLHDWPINKMQPSDCRANEFIDLLCDMIGADHGMHSLKTPNNLGKLDESFALLTPNSRPHGNSSSDPI